MSEFRGVRAIERDSALLASMLEARRRSLTYRLLQHRARTQLIVRFTSISLDRLAAMRRRWNVPNESRRRGPSPSSLVQIMRVPRLRSEGAALASMALMHGAMSNRSGRDSFYSLANAERICDVFELFIGCIHEPAIAFDQYVLPIRSIAQGREISLMQCEACGATLLIDNQAGRPSPCANCRS